MDRVKKSNLVNAGGSLQNFDFNFGLGGSGSSGKTLGSLNHLKGQQSPSTNHTQGSPGGSAINATPWSTTPSRSTTASPPTTPQWPAGPSPQPPTHSTPNSSASWSNVPPSSLGPSWSPSPAGKPAAWAPPGQPKPGMGDPLADLWNSSSSATNGGLKATNGLALGVGRQARSPVPVQAGTAAQSQSPSWGLHGFPKAAAPTSASSASATSSFGAFPSAALGGSRSANGSGLLGTPAGQTPTTSMGALKKARDGAARSKMMTEAAAATTGMGGVYIALGGVGEAVTVQVRVESYEVEEGEVYVTEMSTPQAGGPGVDPFGDVFGAPPAPPPVVYRTTAEVRAADGSDPFAAIFGSVASAPPSSLDSDPFASPFGSSMGGGGGGYVDPLEALMQPTRTPEAGGGGVDFGWGGEDGGGGEGWGDFQAGETTRELEGIGPPPPGVTVPAAIVKGEEFSKQGQYADAIKWLLWAEELCGAGDVEMRLKVLGTRAVCYKEAGEMKKAVADCTQVLEANPRNTSILMQRAILYEGMEKYKLGVEDLKTLTRLDPSNRSALTLMHRLSQAAARS